MLSLLILLAAFCLGFAYSESITLWEFGANRLLGGKFTAPLLPLGVASDGLSTTYLYEVLNPITTVVVNDGTPSIAQTLSSASRTIVASASGWIENFGPSVRIECNFLNENEGECFDISSTAFGTPTPVVLSVASSTSERNAQASITSNPQPESTSALTSATPVPSAAQGTSDDSSRKPSAGAIAGDIIAALLVVCLLGILIFLLRRRRRARRKVLDIEKSSTHSASDHSVPISSRNLPQPQPNIISTRPSLYSNPTSSAESESQAETGSYHFENVRSKQQELQEQARSAREELRLAEATLNGNGSLENGTEQVETLRQRMGDILQRLNRLEEQGSMNDPPPGYVS